MFYSWTKVKYKEIKLRIRRKGNEWSILSSSSMLKKVRDPKKIEAYSPTKRWLDNNQSNSQSPYARSSNTSRGRQSSVIPIRSHGLGAPTTTTASYLPRNKLVGMISDHTVTGIIAIVIHVPVHAWNRWMGWELGIKRCGSWWASHLARLQSVTLVVSCDWRRWHIRGVTWSRSLSSLNVLPWDGIRDLPR